MEKEERQTIIDQINNGEINNFYKLKYGEIFGWVPYVVKDFLLGINDMENIMNVVECAKKQLFFECERGLHNSFIYNGEEMYNNFCYECDLIVEEIKEMLSWENKGEEYNEEKPLIISEKLQEVLNKLVESNFIREDENKENKYIRIEKENENKKENEKKKEYNLTRTDIKYISITLYKANIVRSEWKTIQVVLQIDNLKGDDKQSTIPNKTVIDNIFSSLDIPLLNQRDLEQYIIIGNVEE